MNSSTIDVGIIESACGLHNSPSQLKFELRPPWNNIHDKFPTGTAQDTTVVYSPQKETFSKQHMLICCSGVEELLSS
jgi:hypothetical protein